MKKVLDKMIFRFVKSLFATLFIFRRQLYMQKLKYISLNNELVLGKPTFIHLGPSKLNCYPFIVFLHKCRWYIVIILLMTYLKNYLFQL